MDIPLSELESLAKKYFDGLTPAQFRKDRKKARVDHFNTIREDIFTEYSGTFTCSFGSYEAAVCSAPSESFYVAVEHDASMDVMFADDFIYALAA